MEGISKYISKYMHLQGDDAALAAGSSCRCAIQCLGAAPAILGLRRTCLKPREAIEYHIKQLASCQVLAKSKPYIVKYSEVMFWTTNVATSGNSGQQSCMYFCMTQQMSSQSRFCWVMSRPVAPSIDGKQRQLVNHCWVCPLFPFGFVAITTANPMQGKCVA